MLDQLHSVLDFASSSLTDPDELADWIVTDGWLSAAPAVGDAGLADAAILRDAISRAARTVANGDPVPAREAATINSFADEEPPRITMRPDGTIARTATTPLPAVFSAIARAGIGLLVIRATDLRICEAPTCGQVFLDDSRGRRRRWCSMQRCGNRAKATAFRERQSLQPHRTTPP